MGDESLGVVGVLLNQMRAMRALVCGQAKKVLHTRSHSLGVASDWLPAHQRAFLLLVEMLGQLQCALACVTPAVSLSRHKISHESFVCSLAFA